MSHDLRLLLLVVVVVFAPLLAFGGVRVALDPRRMGGVLKAGRYLCLSPTAPAGAPSPSAGLFETLVLLPLLLPELLK